MLLAAFGSLFSSWSIPTPVQPSEMQLEISPALFNTSLSFDLLPPYRFMWESNRFVVIKEKEIIWSTFESKAFLAVGKSRKDIFHYFFGFKITEEKFDIQSTSQRIERIELLNSSCIQVSGSIGFKKDEDLVDLKYLWLISTDGSRRIQMQFQILQPEDQILQPMELNRLIIEYKSPIEEQIFGFGQQFPRQFNLKGKRVPILVNEQGVGRGLEPLTWIMNTFQHYGGGTESSTYLPMPHYITTKGVSLFLENYEFSAFDLRRQDRIRIEVAALDLKLQVFHESSPLKVIETLTNYTGRMKPLPDWVSKGAIVGTQGGRDFVEKLQVKLEKEQVPIAAYWLQDWVGNRVAPWGIALWWNWEVDRELYWNWEEFIQEMKEKRNIRILSYLNSHAGNISAFKTNIQRHLYDELVQGGMAVLDHQGNTHHSYLQAAMFDLTNPKTVAWIKDLIKDNFIKSRVSGYMCDFGESLQLDAKLFNGNAAEYHNRYSEDWARINYEAVQEAGLQDDFMFFMRAGFLKSPQYTPLFWLGDQLQSWDQYDGLKSAVYGAMMGGFSGIALTHADIGGYHYVEKAASWMPLKYVRTKELFMRSCEFAAFTAAYRSHDGTNKAASWQLYSDDETLAFFGRMARVYTAWHFYRKELMQETAAKGYPLIRHLYLNYPTDPKVFAIKYQFMLGTELLVAPVTDKSRNIVHIYLPQGEWVHVWTNQVYSGDQVVRIQAPMGQPCVLYPVGSTVGATFVSNLHEFNLM